MEEQPEYLIAIALAEIINADDHSKIFDFDLEEENQYGGCGLVSCQSARESMYARVNSMTTQLAMLRAKETDRDFNSVLEEIEFKINIKLEKILGISIHPVFEVLTNFVLDDHGEYICGICQDEMKVEDDVRAMSCQHPFHCECIYKWLNRKMVCPLCRYSPMMEDRDGFLEDIVFSLLR